MTKLDVLSVLILGVTVNFITDLIKLVMAQLF